MTIAIVVVCASLLILRRELKPKLLRLDSKHLSVDANSVVGGPLSDGLRPWVLVTTLFHHADRTHLISNMIMLLATGPEIEQDIGRVWYLMLYLVTGVVGWLATLL